MANHKGKSIPVKESSKPNKKLIGGFIALLVVVAGFFIIKGFSGKGTETASAGNDLVISKSEVSETAKFYPYKVGDKNMEVIAIKAKDGSVRTAFNTCQVCYNSGKGYYKQQGDTLVCQNCGNKFKADQVEQIKGGCNPVPIAKENKTEDADKIVIPKDFLAQNKDLFSNWKKQ